jgi:hypothetical protein
VTQPNPYAPPTDVDLPASVAPGDEGAPAYKLYTPGHAALAAFLGTPLAGLYLVSVNRRRLGLAGEATNALLAGFGATVLLVVAAVLLPDALGRVLPIAATVAVGQYAKRDAPLLDAHLGRGGLKESGWKAAGIGLGAMAAALVLVFTAAFLAGLAAG